jgi:predicted transcriptional regulator
MTLAELAEQFSLKVYTGAGRLNRPVAAGYVGDLLSDVIAHGRRDCLWLTIQIHPNIVAVAVLKELAGILLAGGREPAAETVRKAEEEGVPILGSSRNAYELAGIFYGAGIQGP